MCRACVVDVRPERGRTCLETGSYQVNFLQCQQCGSRQHIQMINRSVTEEEEELSEGGDYTETVTYEHICARCGHCIAEHYYTFTVTHQHITHTDQQPIVRQEYLMECVLCGRGADTSTVLNDLHHHTTTATSDQQTSAYQQHNNGSAAVVISAPTVIQSSVILCASAGFPLPPDEQRSADDEDDWE